MINPAAHRSAETGESGAGNGATRDLLAGTTVYLLISVIQSGGTFMITPAATLVLGARDFGLVATGIGASMLVRAIASAGLPSAISILFFNKRGGIDESRSLLSAATLVALGVAIAAVTAVMVIPAFNGSTLAFGAAIGAGSAIALLLQAWSRCVDRFGIYAAATLGTGVIGQACGLGAVMIFGGGARTFLSTWAGVAIIIVLGVMLFVPARSPFLLPDRMLRGAIRLGAPTVVHTLSATALSVADRFMIEWKLGSLAVGRYQAVYVLSSAGIILAGAAGAAWLPFVLRYRTATERGLALKSSAKTFLVLTSAVGLVATLLAPVMIVLISGAGYEGTGLRMVGGLVGLSTCPFTVYLAAQISLLGNERTRQIAASTLMAALSNVALNAVLIGPLGLNGAAAATLISYCILALAGVIVASRQDPEFHLPAPWIAGAAGTLGASAAISQLVPLTTFFIGVRGALSIGGLLIALGVVRRMVRSDASTEEGMSGGVLEC